VNLNDVRGRQTAMLHAVFVQLLREDRGQPRILGLVDGAGQRENDRDGVAALGLGIDEEVSPTQILSPVVKPLNNLGVVAAQSVFKHDGVRANEVARQGIGGFLAVAGVIWATKQGRDAVADWRTQKQDERAIGAAERVLTAAYKARTSLDGIRANFMTSAELTRAMDKLKTDYPDVVGFSDARQRRLAHSQAIFNRINAYKADWDELFAVMPIANAYFGAEIEAQLEQLARQRQIVSVSADSYGEDDGSDPEFTKQIRADIWRGLTYEGVKDPVATRVTEAVICIEQRLLPVLRSDYVPT